MVGAKLKVGSEPVLCLEEDSFKRSVLALSFFFEEIPHFKLADHTGTS